MTVDDLIEYLLQHDLDATVHIQNEAGEWIEASKVSRSEIVFGEVYIE